MTENEEADAKAALQVKAKCDLANIYVGGLSDPDPEIRQRDSTLYQRHRDEAIASALAIKDEFYQGFAIHQAINLCRSAHDLDIARTLFEEVDDNFLREQILKDAPELAGEKKQHLTGLVELETPEELEKWALEQFPRDTIGGGEAQQILRSWFVRLRKQVDPDSARYGQLISEAVSVLEQLRTGIGGVFWLDEIVGHQKRAARYDLWAWPTEAQVDDWAYRGTGRAGLDDLDQALAAYLKRPWLQHDAIDISAINALLVPGLAEFILELKTGAALGKPNWSFILSGGNMFTQFGLAVAGKIIGFLAAWIMLPALSLILLVYNHETGAIIAISCWGFYLVYRLIMIPIRWRARTLRKEVAKTLADRLTAMVKVWHAAQGKTISPSRLKELLVIAEERGAEFPSVLHTIIDRAISRDATAVVRE